VNIGITCYPSYGGSGVVGAELGLELARRGHIVHFISYASPMRLEDGDRHHERVKFHAVNMLTYPLFEYPPYALALASKLCEVAHQESLDLIHMHYAIPHAVSAYLAREMCKASRYLPFVTTLHGTDITLVGRDPSFLPITRFGIEQSDRVTAISNYLRQATLDTFDVSCPIEVIYNFIDAEFYQRRPDPDLRRGIAPAGESIIVHISTFRPIKRIMDCIEILARLRKAGLGIRLVMCGDGPERADAEVLAARLGVAGDVIFAGQQPQSMIREYLSIADLLLLPSQSESFGLVALEAMACEVPVIATRVGGLPELIDDGVTGLLFGVGDLEAMSAGALRLLRDPATRQQFGHRGRQAAISRFSTERIIPHYEALYGEVIAKRAPSPVVNRPRP
jgi:N-acetyl-alpha-D-glucosaminyl L-malate synthase BshA